MGQHRVAVVVPRGVALFELGVALETFGFRDPTLPEDWYSLKVCTGRPGASDDERGALSVEIGHGVEAIDEADTVIVVDGSVTEPAEQALLEAIRRAYARGARLASYCTGAFVLAAAGVLDGRTATTHWKYAARLAHEYPEVRVHADVLYVDDGQVLTSAGTTAGVDLSLHIIRKDHGARVARHVARHLVMPPHREGGQAQFVMTPIPETSAASTGVPRVIDHVTHHLDEDFSLEEMAAMAYMSTRNFSRRFREVTGTTPSRWILLQRLTRARELLEETDEPIERVAQLAGFGSAVTLRQKFATELQTSPTNYRRSFRTDAEADSALGATSPSGVAPPDPAAAFLRDSVGFSGACGDRALRHA